MKRVVLAAALGLSMTLTPASAAKSNPEADRLPPGASAGYFLGYPGPTYSWHGCTKTATARSPAAPVPGEPPLPRGSKQKAVTFTVQRTAPYVSWEVKSGWKICGVQAGAVLDNPTLDSQLLAEVGYTSGPTKGSTSRTGTETIRVTIPTKGIDQQGFEQYEGLTFSMARIQHVVVFVKRKG